MTSYSLTPLARIDVFQIWVRIANDSEAAADKVEQAIYDACEFVAASPRSGHTRADITGRNLRFWTIPRYPNYILVYRPDTVPLAVIGVVQGKRDLGRVVPSRRH